MKLLILSDIHGNLSALERTLQNVEYHHRVDACVLLGDLIDYGMHSNEVVSLLKKPPYPILCNIRGNHEQAVLTGDYKKFASERGRLCAQYTRSTLAEDTKDYLANVMCADGMCEFEVDGKKCLAVHGSLEDMFWKSIKPCCDLYNYQKYDLVFSGHSHVPHFFEFFHDAEDPKHRNKKKTIFVNPGSVGQPRNHNPMAQFAIFDTEKEEIVLKKLPYDIVGEQKAYRGQVDDFYWQRLETGV